MNKPIKLLKSNDESCPYSLFGSVCTRCPYNISLTFNERISSTVFCSLLDSLFCFSRRYSVRGLL